MTGFLFSWFLFENCFNSRVLLALWAIRALRAFSDHFLCIYKYCIHISLSSILAAMTRKQTVCKACTQFYSSLQTSDLKIYLNVLRSPHPKIVVILNQLSLVTGIWYKIVSFRQTLPHLKWNTIFVLFVDSLTTHNSRWFYFSLVLFAISKFSTDKYLHSFS